MFRSHCIADKKIELRISPSGLPLRSLETREKPRQDQGLYQTVQPGRMHGNDPDCGKAPG
ncbi:MAG: hypothetical protein Kow009_00130 [Spirochaetales bacterium]